MPEVADGTTRLRCPFAALDLAWPPRGRPSRTAGGVAGRSRGAAAGVEPRGLGVVAARRPEGAGDPEDAGHGARADRAPPLPGASGGVCRVPGRARPAAARGARGARNAAP